MRVCSIPFFSFIVTHLSKQKKIYIYTWPMRRVFNFRHRYIPKMNSNQSSMLTDEEANLYDRQIRLWGADAQLQ